jgi:hypothetical protein
MTNKLPMEARAVFSLCVLQILFKIVFESEGAKKIMESGDAPLPGGMPMTIVAILGILWFLLTIWSVFYKKISYVFIMAFATLNLFPLVLVWFGKTPYVGRPFFNGWMTLCLIYFAYQAYQNYQQ